MPALRFSVDETQFEKQKENEATLFNFILTLFPQPFRPTVYTYPSRKRSFLKTMTSR